MIAGQGLLSATVVPASVYGIAADGDCLLIACLESLLPAPLTNALLPEDSEKQVKQTSHTDHDIRSRIHVSYFVYTFSTTNGGGRGGTGPRYASPIIAAQVFTLAVARFASPFISSFSYNDTTAHGRNSK